MNYVTELLGIYEPTIPITQSPDHHSPDDHRQMSQSLSGSQLLEEANNRFNSAIKVRDVELLVRRVQIIIGEAETHHDGGYLQVLLKIPHNGNRAATANVDGLFVEDLLHRFGGCFYKFIVSADDDWLCHAPAFDFELNPFRRERIHVLAIAFENVLRIHIR